MQHKSRASIISQTHEGCKFVYQHVRNLVSLFGFQSKHCDLKRMNFLKLNKILMRRFSLVESIESNLSTLFFILGYC